MPRHLAPTLAPAAGVTHVQARIAPGLHALMRVAAASRGQSVQQWMLAALRGSVLRQAADGDTTLAAALDAARGEGE